MDKALIEEERETEMGRNDTSPLVWQMVRMATELMQLRVEPRRPKVGDTVIEYTHVLGLARKRLGLVSAVGQLIEVTKDEHGHDKYLIRTPAGEETWWDNAGLFVIDSPHDRA